MQKLRHWVFATMILAFFAVAFITWSVSYESVIALLSEANHTYTVLFLSTSLLIAFLLTFKWRLVLDSQKIHVPFHRLFAYRLVSYSVSYLTPTIHAGSEPIRAVLLQREGIESGPAISNVIIDKSVELIMDVVFFFFGALLILNSVIVAGYTKAIFLSISLALIALMGGFIQGILREESMFVSLFRTLRLNKIEKLKHIEKNLVDIEMRVQQFYKEEKLYFLTITALMALVWICMFFEYKFALLMIGQDPTLAQIFLILTGVGIAYSIPIPAAMGALELGQISAAKVLRLSSVTAVGLTIIIRIRDLMWTTLGLIYLVFYHFNFKTLAREQKELDRKFEKGKLLDTKQ